MPTSLNRNYLVDANYHVPHPVFPKGGAVVASFSGSLLMLSMVVKNSGTPPCPSQHEGVCDYCFSPARQLAMTVISLPLCSGRELMMNFCSSAETSKG